jgi:hypothetical protein
MRRAPVEASLAQSQAKYRYFAQRREAAKLRSKFEARNLKIEIPK